MTKQNKTIPIQTFQVKNLLSLLSFLLCIITVQGDINNKTFSFSSFMSTYDKYPLQVDK